MSQDWLDYLKRWEVAKNDTLRQRRFYEGFYGIAMCRRLERITKPWCPPIPHRERDNVALRPNSQYLRARLQIGGRSVEKTLGVSDPHLSGDSRTADDCRAQGQARKCKSARGLRSPQLWAATL